MSTPASPPDVEVRRSRRRRRTVSAYRDGDRIVVRRSNAKVRFLHPHGWSYYGTLRRKLHWNEGVA